MLEFLKGKKVYSILTGSCPVCHKESMYLEPNPYKMAWLFKMHDRCSQCETKYKIEPSFFFGAMYVSYGLGIGLGAASFIITHYIIGMGIWPSFIVIIIVLIVFLPIISRLSRNIWINLFLNYKE